MNTLRTSDNWFELGSYLDIQVGDVSLMSEGQGLKELEHEPLHILNKKYNK